MRIRMVACLLVAVVLYCVYAGVIFTFQRELLYPGRHTPVERPATLDVPGLEQVWLLTSQGRVEAWYFPPLGREATTKGPALIFAHGNGEVIDQWKTGLDPFRDMGFAVLAVEFPGYGRSAGLPTEASLRETFLLSYDALVQRPAVDPARVVGFGQSLGGGAVGALLRERPLAAVVLLSTFTSIRPFARRYGVPSFLVRDVLDTQDALRSYPGPVLVIHGRADELIPFQEGVALSTSTSRARLVAYDCGHWCWYPERLPIWADLRTFFEQAGVIEPARRPSLS